VALRKANEGQIPRPVSDLLHEARYREIVEALYSGAKEVHFDTTVTYEDGRVGHSKTDLFVMDVQGETG